MSILGLPALSAGRTPLLFIGPSNPFPDLSRLWTYTYHLFSLLKMIVKDDFGLNTHTLPAQVSSDDVRQLITSLHLRCHAHVPPYHVYSGHIYLLMILKRQLKPRQLPSLSLIFLPAPIPRPLTSTTSKNLPNKDLTIHTCSKRV